MSLSEQFQENIDNYVNQMSAYNEQVDAYKNQLIDAKGQAADLTKSLITEAGVPIATEIARMGATKLFGEAAGAQVSKLAGSALKTVAGGDSSSSGILSNMRASLGPEADTAAATESESALTSTVNVAKQGLKTVLNRIKGGTEDAVSGAEDAVSGAKAALSDATDNLLSSVTDRIAGQAGSIIQQQVARLSSLDAQNVVQSVLTSADFPKQMLGDVELSDMASAAVSRMGVPDTSLPIESTYDVPGLTEPMDMPGVTSNIIGRLFSGAKQLINPEVPDSVIPSQEEALDMLTQQIRPLITSDLLPQGAGEIAGTIGQIGQSALGTAGEGIGETIGGLVSQATKAIPGLSEPIMSTVTSAISGASEAASTATGVASAVGEAVGTAAGEAGAEVAAGAAGGPAGLIIGGLIALGTTLYDLFHHDHSTSTIAPIAPLVSAPAYQPGLATGN